MSSWAFQPLLPAGTDILSEGQIQAWNGNEWLQKPIRYWDGTQWVAKRLKYWNGVEWVRTPSNPTTT